MTSSHFEKMNSPQKEFLMAIGECLTTWATVELYLSMLFSQITGMKNLIGFAVWDSVISFEAKLNALNAAFNIAIQDDDLKSIWGELGNRISKKHKKRNEIVHSTLVNVDNVSKLVPYFVIGKQAKNGLSPKEIVERTQSFQELAAAIYWFIQRAAFLKEGVPKVPLQAPDLILRLQTKVAQTHAKTLPPLQSSKD
ncbi:MAG TPA: hypothetical protein VMV79_02975 [Alphaproteobacteria bacterium]|nr:hypothetical protein [Alphaproteobacteria bacterium]